MKALLRVLRLATTFASFVLVGAGCTGVLSETPSGTTESTLTVDADWVEPEWMASHRALGSEWREQQYTCISDLGASPLVSLTGWDVVLRTDINVVPTGMTQSEFSELSGAAQVECLELFPRPNFGGDEANPELYSRMLDTRNCLIAHGQQIPDPPAQEVWIRSGGRWNPVQQVPWGFLDSEDGALLIDACPQSGPFWWVFIMG